MERYQIVGKTFTNKAGFEFVVLRRREENGKRGIPLYDIQFTKSGYVLQKVSSGHIRKGQVKDPFSPSVFGVGCLGFASGYAKRHESRRIYYTWRNMIRRCYDKSYAKYRFYGGKGVYVCERWHRLDLFIDDMKLLPGYDPDLFEAGEIELDKDILVPDNNVYSKETCCFVSHSVNVSHAFAKMRAKRKAEKAS